MVQDPLKREINKQYLEDVSRLKEKFAVLTCGEHGGRRGVNRLVEKALNSEKIAKENGFYLPGLAACGVEFQDRFSNLSYPGLKDNEINFALVPDIPESLEPIVEKANTFNNNYSQSNSLDKSNLINNSSAIASIEYDEDVATIATLKMLNPTWLQLRDESNNIILSKLMDKDEEFSYELKLNYNITAGNAGNILVLIDGEVRGKIGKFGDILDSFVLFKDFTN